MRFYKDIDIGENLKDCFD